MRPRVHPLDPDFPSASEPEEVEPPVEPLESAPVVSWRLFEYVLVLAILAVVAALWAYQNVRLGT